MIDYNAVLGGGNTTISGDKAASQPERATAAQIPTEFARLRDNVQGLGEVVDDLLAQISVVMLPAKPVNEASKAEDVGGCILAMDLARITEQVQNIGVAIRDAQKRIQL